MENQLIETGDVRQALAVAGWDLESELAGMAVETTQLELPRVRIEHKDSGRHRMYIDSLESYMDAENQEIKLPGNKLTAVVFAEQFIRALWKQSDEIPTCSAIDDTPLAVEPISDSCRHCENGNIGGACKPKVRLLLLAEIEGDIRPLIMTLSPTSIKHWNAHKKKLQRSNLPVVAVNTTFELVDTKRGTYRWAEVRVSMDGIASKELLISAKTARTEFEDLTRRISDADFGDSGDKQQP
ncbi:MAG: hypothetical protein HOB84_03635 [Candidatus Marinimicrobia bacterium]|jgi:hypothetical protein|nr:hypothetical protein [Candidatus Neomarinimicrobiota bacterium]MBT5271482.1 hypothetical protein [Candidatus Neomarinimicrobiota bacterium]